MKIVFLTKFPKIVLDHTRDMKKLQSLKTLHKFYLGNPVSKLSRLHATKYAAKSLKVPSECTYVS